MSPSREWRARSSSIDLAFGHGPHLSLLASAPEGSLVSLNAEPMMHGDTPSRRVVTILARFLAVIALLVVGVGIPVAVVSTVGPPWPSAEQWSRLRADGRVDAATAVRIGLAMTAVLWAWFCATALHEALTVVVERHRSDDDGRGGRAVPVRSSGSWIRRLVRLAIMGGAATAVALGVASLGSPSSNPPVRVSPTADSVAASTTVTSTDPVSGSSVTTAAGSSVVDPVASGDGSSVLMSTEPASRWPVAALGSLAVAGVVAELGRRRRRVLRATIPGDVVAIPSVALADVEEAVRGLAAGEDMARVDFALAAASRALGVAGSGPLLVLAGVGGDVRMLPSIPARPDDGVWNLDPRDGWWVVHESVDLLSLAAAAGPAPAPARLVELGRLVGSSPRTDGARVMVDLERMGRLDVCGGGAADVARALCIGLAATDRCGGSRIVTLGLGRAVDWSPSVHDSSDRGEWESDLALAPAKGGEASCEPWFGVLPRDEVTACPRDLLERATALITWSDVDGGARSGSTPALVMRGDAATLTPWGLELIPVRATAEMAEVVADLVLAPVVESLNAAADDITEVGEASVSVPTSTLVSPPRTAPEDRAASPAGPAFVVRLLGPVRVESLDGTVVEFERSKALELVAWLATHRSRPTRGRARAALWEVDVRSATFHNVISDARRSMMRVVFPPEGEEWIGRADSEVLPLHASVVCDLDLLERALAECDDLDDTAAVALLLPAVDLLEGAPFSGTDYLWSDAEGISSAAVLAATSAATELARRCLALGDVHGVFAATGRGLMVLPGHEELVSLRMRAHDTAGDRAGVRDEWERYLRVLAADAWPGDGDGATPPPKMLALRRALLP